MVRKIFFRHQKSLRHLAMTLTKYSISAHLGAPRRGLRGDVMVTCHGTKTRHGNTAKSHTNVMVFPYRRERRFPHVRSLRSPERTERRTGFRRLPPGFVLPLSSAASDAAMTEFSYKMGQIHALTMTDIVYLSTSDGVAQLNCILGHSPNHERAQRRVNPVPIDCRFGAGSRE